MDNMLKNEFGLSKAVKRWIITGVTIFLVLSVCFCGLLYTNTRTAVREQAVRNLTNISSLNEDSITRAFQNREKLLKVIANRLEKREIYEVEGILAELKDFASSYECYHMGVLDANHMLYRTNGDISDVAGMELTKLIWDRNPHVTKSYYPSDSDEFMVNMFSQPVFQNGRVKCVIVATYYSEELVRRMNINPMQGSGYSFLLDENGEIVIDSQQYWDETYNGLARYIDKNAETAPGKDNERYFEYDGEKYYAQYVKLGINRWYLMTCAKEEDVFGEARLITFRAFAGIGIMWIFIFAAIAITCLAVWDAQQKIHKSHFYDDLLGIGNENALEVYFRKLPQEELSNMHLVVFNVDKFKEFNYIYGDEKGDELLKYIVRVFREEVPEVTLFRYKSDYFIALDPSEDRSELEDHVKKTQDRFARDREAGVIPPFDTSGGIRRVEAGVSLRQLLSDAIIAKSTIEGNHLRHRAYYDEALRTRQTLYMEMESALPAALRNNEF